MNLKESLIHHGFLGEDDFVIIEVDQLETKEVRRGVVFMYAKWSAFSISC